MRYFLYPLKKSSTEVSLKQEANQEFQKTDENLNITLKMVLIIKFYSIMNKPKI